MQVDLKIENILRRLRREAHVNTMAVTRQQTLKELTAPNMENQPLCINIDNNVKFKLKYGFIHLLPTFNGFADLEIENTLCRLQKEARVNTMVVARQQTLKEIDAPLGKINYCA